VKNHHPDCGAEAPRIAAIRGRSASVLALFATGANRIGGAKLVFYGELQA